MKSSRLLSASEINATGFNYQNEDEKVTLSFPSTLQKGERQRPSSVTAQPPAHRHVLIHCDHTSPGSGSLKIDFVGELNDKMKGFYRSKYTTPAGEVRYAAVTQFEVSRCLNKVKPVAQLAICAPVLRHSRLR